MTRASPESRPTHHDFESVLGWIRLLRSQDFVGTISLVMYRREIVKVTKQETLRHGPGGHEPAEGKGKA
jgi:hypothetical protein